MPKSAQPLTPHRWPAAGASCRSLRLLGVCSLVVLLAACASGGGQRSSSGPHRPGPAPAWERDGPGLSPPPDLAGIPDAVPAIEPFRSGTMRPYQVLGRRYVPITEDLPHHERGLASWYGRKFHGRPTAIGEPYDMYAMTAAHPTLPLPSYVRVRNPANQREVVVRLNDRGPFHPGRIIDLSYAAAWKLDLLRAVAPVEIERITLQQIRDGTWQRDAHGGGLQQAAAPATAVRERPAVAPQLIPVAATHGETTAGPASSPVQPAGVTTHPVAAPAPATTRELLPAAEPDPAPAWQGEAVQAYWVQLGAFRMRDGADSFRRRVSADIGWIAPQLTVRSDAELHRLQAGPYADREQAVGIADRLRESLQLVPVIVEQR